MKRLTQEEFLEKAKNKHGEKYDYSKAEYIDNKKKLIIICKDHGEFWQTPSNHLFNNRGCQKCGVVRVSHGKLKDINYFIKKAKEKHRDKYDYSKSIYTGVHNKLVIICKTHGEFLQTPHNHLQNNGCKKCGLDTLADNKKYTEEIFIKISKTRHGDIYGYDKVHYTGAENKVTLTCKKHGDFNQTASKHITGSGCPKCSHNISSGEIEVKVWLEKEGFKTTRSKVNNLELDIFLPEYNLAIEYNGLYWHREEAVGKEYHLNKTNLCKQRGIGLIHIFEDNWIKDKEQTKDKILGILSYLKSTDKSKKSTLSLIRKLHGVTSNSIEIDLTWSLIIPYEELGFKRVNTFPPEFFWVKRGYRISTNATNIDLSKHYKVFNCGYEIWEY